MIKVVCMDCHEQIGELDGGAVSTFDRVSHGLCPDCYNRRIVGIKVNLLKKLVQGAAEV